jgi:hypothetical protein
MPRKKEDFTPRVPETAILRELISGFRFVSPIACGHWLGRLRSWPLSFSGRFSFRVVRGIPLR